MYLTKINIREYTNEDTAKKIMRLLSNSTVSAVKRQSRIPARRWGIDRTVTHDIKCYDVGKVIEYCKLNIRLKMAAACIDVCIAVQRDV